jgi:hypothetical protein
VLWLVLEVAGYFALSPFAAVRRVLGVVVVGTLLAGRLAARTCRSPERAGLVHWAALAGVLLGLGFYGVDLREAWARKAAAERAARWVRRRQPDAIIWYAGGDGFQYYAERAGMRRLVPGAAPGPGEWLVTDASLAGLAPAPDAPAHVLTVGDRLPLRTFLCYYGSGTPLEHHEGPRVTLAIYRYERARPCKAGLPVAPPAGGG